MWARHFEADPDLPIYGADLRRAGKSLCVTPPTLLSEPLPLSRFGADLTLTDFVSDDPSTLSLDQLIENALGRGGEAT
jgi:hypothetical protein